MSDVQMQILQPQNSIDDIARHLKNHIPAQATEKDAYKLFKNLLGLAENKSIPYRQIDTTLFFEHKVQLFKDQNPVRDLIGYLVFVILSFKQERWRIVRDFNLPEVSNEKIGEKLRMKIAGHTAREFSDQIAPLFKNFNLKSPELSCFVFFRAVYNNHTILQKMENYIQLEDQSPQMQSIIAALKDICVADTGISVMEKRLAEITQAIFPTHAKELIEAFQLSKNSPFEYRNNAVWFLTSIGRILLSKNSSSILENLEKHHIIPLLIRSSLPKIKDKLFDIAIKVFGKEELRKLFEEGIRMRKISSTPTSKPVLGILLAVYWVYKGLAKNSGLQLIKRMPLRDLKKGNHQLLFFRIFIRFINEADIYREKLATKIQQVFLLPEGAKRFKALTQIYLASLLGCLPEILAQQRHEVIDAKFVEIIFSHFPEIELTPSLKEGYEKKFASSHYPDFLPAYIADLSLLPPSEKKLVFPVLGEFITSVIDDSFLEKRYQIERSKHLKAIHEIDETVLSIWKENIIVEIDEDTLLEETDAPLELASAANNVPEGNCQRVPGEFTKNRALLGDILHGHMKLVSLKHNDTVVANTYMILLIDKEKKSLTLMLDLLYPARITDQEKAYFIDFAKAKAKKIGLPLVSVKDGNGDYYEGELTCLGGPAPYILCDALDMLCKNGEYTLPQNTCRYIV